MYNNSRFEETVKKKLRLLAILLVLNLLATAGVTAYLVSNRPAAEQKNEQTEGFIQGMETGEKYILYIGTNDKDTYTQLIPTDAARDMVNRICAKYTGGYTESDARGGWVDETDTLTQENTLVYEFYDIAEEQLTQIMDDVLRELNQNSILVERRETVYSYYSRS